MAKPKRRKLTKAQAREQALRQRRRRRMTWALVGVVSLAVLAVLVVIAMSGDSGGLVEVEALREDVETGITDEGQPYRGSVDAPVTIVEVSDYNCSVCGEFNATAFPAIDDELLASGRVRYVSQPFALWEGSLPIVEAALCAQEQDSFWDFHHILFANQKRFSTQQPPSRGMLREMAQVVGLDADALETCLDEERHAEEALASTEYGKVELGVDSTPAFFVNGTRTLLYRDEAYIDTIRKAVEAAEAAGPAP